MVDQVTYKAFCVNEECGYVLNKSWAFKPNFIADEVCPRCESKYELRVVEDDRNIASSSIINNRGELHNKVGTEWCDLLRRIKKGSPHSNMKDY